MARDMAPWLRLVRPYWLGLHLLIGGFSGAIGLCSVVVIFVLLFYADEPLVREDFPSLLRVTAVLLVLAASHGLATWAVWKERAWAWMASLPAWILFGMAAAALVKALNPA
jgi:hypothetical protein